MKQDELISELGLEPHPEGGHYREVYRAHQTMPCPWHEGEQRSVATSIYYLLVRGDFSAFHRIRSDELWHFYEGDPLEVIVLDKEAGLTKNLLSQACRQFVVPRGHWFASRSTGAYSLAGCTVSPGFDFRDFELAIQQELLGEYPENEDIILQLTRP